MNAVEKFHYAACSIAGPINLLIGMIMFVSGPSHNSQATVSFAIAIYCNIHVCNYETAERLARIEGMMKEVEDVKEVGDA